MGRRDRIDELLRSAISRVLTSELKDPRVKLATVTSVQSTGDLSQARVLISVLGSDEDRATCIEALRGAKGFVRSQLASRLRLRTVPELRFELDRGAEHSQRISEILEGLHDSEPGT